MLEYLERMFEIFGDLRRLAGWPTGRSSVSIFNVLGITDYDHKATLLHGMRKLKSFCGVPVSEKCVAATAPFSCALFSRKSRATRPIPFPAGGCVLAHGFAPADQYGLPLRVHLENLPADMDERELREIANEFGELTACLIWRSGNCQKAILDS